MLHTLKDLQHYAIWATDGAVGHLADLYFDDQAWIVRYFVVATGGWLAGLEVLISPLALSRAPCRDKTLPVSITRAQVKESPDIDTHKPVSRQHESLLLTYYNFPFYWGDAGLWGGAPYAGITLAGAGIEDDEALAHTDTEDHHLRSAKAMIDYRVQAKDDHVGHVCELVIDEHSWAVRYIIVDIGSWWHGHQVLIAPEWIDDVSWLDRTVSVDLTRSAVETAPIYDASAPPEDGAHDRGLYTANGPIDRDVGRRQPPA
ncbi:MAG: PRC-barrel domain-containing protein [Salinisphaera sp.]|uniref:PRC-barrel domain-containing protein n=1 Tax=Salinisphaera sp. TaxID=1914330 RepID=UPI003C7BC023